MATNPTKILMYDLDKDLSDLLSSLKTFQGSYATIYERLNDLDSATFTDTIKEIIDDLISGYQDGSVLTINRIKKVAESVTALEGKLAAIGYDSVNMNEHFTYDPTYGNVTKHEVTGDRVTTINYNYSDLATGKLSTSVQTYTNADGKVVTITKTYTYDLNDNITDIGTVTTIVP